MGIYMQAAGRMTEIIGNDYRSAARRLIKRGLRGMDVDWAEEHTDRILRHSRVSVPLIDTSDDVGSCRDTMRCTFSIVMRAKRINSRS